MNHVIKKHLVAASLERLRQQKTHTLFAGYLCLQKRFAQYKTLNITKPEFTEFFNEFFFVKNHPLGAPYIKIFTEQKPSNQNLWLNKNVAGSYAPSSLRADQPFRQVVDIKGKEYTLPKNHAELAFQHLLYGEQVQIADLAVVLYRDYRILKSDFTIFDLVEMFAYEFGYLLEGGKGTNKNFNTLYSLKTANDWSTSWLVDNE